MILYCLCTLILKFPNNILVFAVQLDQNSYLSGVAYVTRQFLVKGVQDRQEIAPVSVSCRE